MRLKSLAGFPAVAALLTLPKAGYAQDATLSGTVSDSTGGVLPGVVVRAVHEASGNTFEGVTDGRGSYRISLRTGMYRINADLQGFTSVNKRGWSCRSGRRRW